LADEPREHSAPRHSPRQDDRQRHRNDRPRKSQPERPAAAAKIAHIDEARSRRPARPHIEEGDESHLPAFLLRPVTLKA
jgi:hypothetical protein